MNQSKPIIFEPTVESLRQYTTPAWYKDAKFGIYCHWNAQSASRSANNGWYAREMYKEGGPAYRDHLKNWGHPSLVGYRDIIEAWHPDRFDAAEWIDLFRNAGARYVMTMAVHHDNFDFWDSRFQPKWNSMNYGPKCDVCSAMRRECLKAGLRWGARTHLARSYSWFQTNKGADTAGEYKGVPYDGNRPELEDLYHEQARPDQIGDDEYHNIRYPLKPSASWVNMWKNRITDLIDNYHPDHLYFDGAVPFMNDSGKVGMEVIAHFYNHNARMHDGSNQGVMVIKDGPDHGCFYEGISSVVLERSREENIVEIPRETENSIGPWFYDGNQESYRSSEDLLHEMIDVISKNCNFVLNVPPRPDGSFDDRARSILNDFGTWLDKNGRAVFGTQAWLTFGEGDVRFTSSGRRLFVICLKAPSGRLLLQSMRRWKPRNIRGIRADNRQLDWNLTPSGLEITVPERFPDDSPALVLEIECSDSARSLPCDAVNLQSVKEENQANRKQYGADGQGRVELTE